MDQSSSEISQNPEKMKISTLEERESDTKGCPCQRGFTKPEVDLRSIKKLVTKNLNSETKLRKGEPEKGIRSNAFHIIKLMRESLCNVERDWRKYLDICAKKGSNLNLNNREWGWLWNIKCEDEESLDQEDLLDKVLLGKANKQKNPEISMQERSDIAECEKEQIRLLATQIKMQRGEIRHFKRILEEGIWGIENKNTLGPQQKKREYQEECSQEERQSKSMKINQEEKG